MECRFLKHGLAVSYDQVVKPCCVWIQDKDYQQKNRVAEINPTTWHSSDFLENKRQQLAQGAWPQECHSCEKTESQGREDSMRGNGNHAYAHYGESDITLEIRPGSVCNFACQTCWPEASSRVAQYQHQAGMIHQAELDSHAMDDFSWLLPVTHRIKDVILLGGEPFYDKNCKKFLDWANSHLDANLFIFTNGSNIDFDFLRAYRGNITLIFSLDAMDRAAEYIRFGTNWAQVVDNFTQCKLLSNVTLRVNVTTSVFNYVYLETLLTWLSHDWPSVVSFGSAAKKPIYSVAAIPDRSRPKLLLSLQRTIAVLETAKIEPDQKSNAVNAIKSMMATIENMDYNQDINDQFRNYVMSMDRVKHISIKEYCPEVYDYLSNNT